MFVVSNKHMNINININKYLNPENLLKIKDCKIISEMVARGVITGKHKSSATGSNIEFSEYREYTYGDSLRNIDWKVFAKKDKLYIKKQVEETNLNAYLIVDISASMNYKSNGVSKYEYSIMLAGAIIYLLIMQKDLTGLILFNNGIKKIVNLNNKNEQIFRILTEMLDSPPQNNTDFTQLLNSFHPLLKKRSLFIIISDFLSDFDKIVNFTVALKKSKNDIYCFHVLDKTEIDGPQHDAVYTDMETGEKIDIDYKYIKNDYKKYFDYYLNTLKYKFNSNKISYCLYPTNENFVLQLRRFLDKIK